MSSPWTDAGPFRQASVLCLSVQGGSTWCFELVFFLAERDIVLCPTFLKKIFMAAYTQIKQSALVVVLGDLGHSPRMLNHIRELLNNEYAVDCISYVGRRAGWPNVHAV